MRDFSAGKGTGTGTGNSGTAVIKGTGPATTKVDAQTAFVASDGQVVMWDATLDANTQNCDGISLHLQRPRASHGDTPAEADRFAPPSCSEGGSVASRQLAQNDELRVVRLALGTQCATMLEGSMGGKRDFRVFGIYFLGAFGSGGLGG